MGKQHEDVVSTSSSEEERDDKFGRGGPRDRTNFVTPPFKRQSKSSTPSTVTEMTPSPLGGTPFSFPYAKTPAHHKRTQSPSFVDVQEGYLLRNEVSTALFRDETPSRSRRKSRSSSRVEGGPLSPRTAHENSFGKRRSRSNPRSRTSGGYQSSSPESMSPESSPDTSPSRRGFRSPLPTSRQDSMSTMKPRGGKNKSWMLAWMFVAIVMIPSVVMMTMLSMRVVPSDHFEPMRPMNLHHHSEAGLRGKMTQGHWEDKKPAVQKQTKRKPKDDDKKRKDAATKHIDETKVKVSTTKAADKASHSVSITRKTADHHKDVDWKGHRHSTLTFHLPPPLSKGKSKFAAQDPNLYATSSSDRKRVVLLDPSVGGGGSLPHHHRIKVYPADFTDNTQLYPILDSSDERLSHMELREPYSDGECVPMQEWQTTFHPSCNGMHELAMENLGEKDSNNMKVFGTKGFWRNAWRVDVNNDHTPDTVVLKTLKFEHNFEDAHFEHDRVDAVAMERLTSSPHVINVFGFCGHSVITEFADGSRVGSLADKAKKTPLARLKIASDIAHGLADVHGIDGDGNATFVHLDINPANVVSVGGTLKLNDFNIGILRRWNTTSNTACGFPAQYPNPQWRSPEEARNEQYLTEKVDVFSMGHIFFRLICGHEPWNKLEPGGKPSKEEIDKKVQKGVMPFVPDDIRNSQNPEVVAIRDAMLKCYHLDPTARPSAREIAQSFDKVLDELSNNNYGSYSKTEQ